MHWYAGCADARQQMVEVGPDVDLRFTHVPAHVADRRGTDAAVMEPDRPGTFARQHAG